MNKKNNNYSSEEVLNCLCSVFQTRMEAFSNYSNQVWNRFNWLLTLQTGIAGFFLSNISSTANSASSIIILAIFICFFWLLLGIEDFYGLKNHSGRVKLCQKIIVSRIQSHEKEFSELEIEDSQIIKFKQTSLLFIFPATILIAWLLVFWRLY